ncbi:MAG: pirin family protein [Alcaligenaceae bacterium]|nr:pirin family protein [Alcaligenaceae bacterium]
MNTQHSFQAETVTHSRDIERLVEGVATSDGAGVKLTRVLSQPLQQRLDPYLMLDAFGSDQPDDYIAGFPDHPHRGFETITYMIAGRMLHRDSAGHEGLLENGGVQWMVAGRGVIHSEIPQQEEGVMQGFQLWLNLPAADKMTAPWYRDIPAEKLPRFTTPDNVAVTVIAGRSHGIKGAVERPVTEPLYLDLHFSGTSPFQQSLPAGHNAFLYVYEGSLDVNGRTVNAGRMGVLSSHAEADGVVIEAQAGTRALLLAGKPLKERIVQYGPFVMNSEEEIHQAFSDYRAGHFSGAIANSQN